MNPQESQNNTEQHDDKLLIEHDYDGIKELNNPPPSWLMWLFYVSIFGSVMYAAYFHWFGQGYLQAGEYEQEVVAANEKYKDAQSKSLDVDNLVLFTDDANLTSASQLFTTSCTVCHGQKGEGNAIGPNLCDEYWITGNTPKDIFLTIKNGTPNGMTSFKQLSDEQVLQLASFIKSKLQGSNPANGKAAQGKKF